MDLPVPHFSEREWKTIRAALHLWLSVSENSRLHPINHKGMAEIFDGTAPLTSEEIESLIERHPRLYITDTELAKRTKRAISTTRNRLKKLGLTPVLPGTNVYNWRWVRDAFYKAHEEARNANRSPYR